MKITIINLTTIIILLVMASCAQPENKDNKNTTSANPIPGKLKKVSCTTSSISFIWNAVSNATGYKLYQSADNVTYTEVGTPDTASCELGGLGEGVGNYYRVTATVGGAESEPGNTILAYTALTSPENFRFTNGSTETSVEFTWSVTNTAAGYLIYKKFPGESSFESLPAITDPTKTTFTDYDIEYNATYAYYIIAYKGDAVSNPPASYVTYKADIKTVAGFKVDYEATNYITLAWSLNENITGYYIYRSEDRLGNYVRIYRQTNKYVTTYSDPGLSRGQRMYYRICSYLNTRDNSNPVYDTAGDRSDPVEGITVPNNAGYYSGTSFITESQTDAINDYVTLRWTHPDGNADGVTLYKLYSLTGGAFVIDDATIAIDMTASATNHYDYDIDDHPNSFIFYTVGRFKNYVLTAGKKIALKNNTDNSLYFDYTRTRPIAPVFTTGNVTGESSKLKINWTEPQPALITGESYHYTIEYHDGLIWKSLHHEEGVDKVFTKVMEPGIEYRLRMYTESNYTDIKTGSLATRLSYQTDEQTWTARIDPPEDLTSDKNKLASIDLDWDPVVVPGYTIWYKIYRNDGTGWSSTPYDTSTISAYHDEGFIHNTNYTYRVTAYLSTNVNAESYPSNETSVVRVTFGAPTISVSQPSNSCNSLNVSWSSVDAGILPSNGTTLSVTYVVRRSTDNTNWTENYRTYTSPTTSFNDSPVSVGTTYYYQVKAKLTGRPVITSVNSGSDSETVIVPSTAFNNNSGAASTTSIYLEWGPITGVDGYKIYRDGDDTNPIYTTSSNSWTNTELTSKVEYIYKIRAYKGVYDSTISGPKSISTP